MFKQTEGGKALSEVLLKIITKHAELLEQTRILYDESTDLSEKNRTRVHNHFHDLLQMGKELSEFQEKVKTSTVLFEELKTLETEASSENVDSRVLEAANELVIDLATNLKQLFAEIKSLKERFDQANEKISINSALIKTNIKKIHEEQDNFLRKVQTFKQKVPPKEKDLIAAIVRLEEDVTKEKDALNYDNYLDPDYREGFNVIFQKNATDLSNQLTQCQSFQHKISSFSTSKKTP